MTSWIGKGTIKSFLVEFISLQFPIECHQLATLRKARFHKTFFAIPTIKRVRVKQHIRSPLMPTYFLLIFHLACYQQVGRGWVRQRKQKVRWHQRKTYTLIYPHLYKKTNQNICPGQVSYLKAVLWLYFQSCVTRL